MTARQQDSAMIHLRSGNRCGRFCSRKRRTQQESSSASWAGNSRNLRREFGMTLAADLFHTH
jgi:hypothetical protein